MGAAVPSTSRNVLIQNGYEALLHMEGTNNMVITKMQHPPGFQSKAPGTSPLNSDCGTVVDRQHDPGGTAVIQMIPRFGIFTPIVTSCVCSEKISKT